MNINPIYPYNQEPISYAGYEARKELVTRLVKEGKITLEEAFILVGLSTIPSVSIPSVWDPITISNGYFTTITTNSTSPDVTGKPSNLNHNFTSK